MNRFSRTIPWRLLLCGWLAVIGVIAVAQALLGQGTQEDYERADRLRERFRDKVFRTDVEPRWFGAGKGWYRVQTAKDRYEYVVFDASNATRKLAFDHEEMAQTIRELTQSAPRSENLGITDLVFGENEALTQFRLKDKTWKRESAAEPWKSAETPRADDAPRSNRRQRENQSSDGKWRIFVRDHNLWLQSPKDDTEEQLTFDGNQVDAYQEQIHWSPDSSRFIAFQREQLPTRQLHLIESSPKNSLYPVVHRLDYAKPGDRLPKTRLRLFDIAARTSKSVADDLFPNPWRLTKFRWSADSREFRFIYNQRSHQTLRLVGVDGETGTARAIIDETSPTFIDYAYKQYSHQLKASREIVWMSERDGWNHLYLYDEKTGRVKNQITKGDWVVRRVDHVDEDRRVVWFQAGGVVPGQDPYYLHACRVNLDGTGLVVLTSSDGTHRVRYSPDRRFLVATHSRVDQAPITELRNGRDGSLIAVLERADTGELEAAGWRTPEPFAAKGRDGVTDIYGVIYRPSNFSQDLSYPVIEHIYAGPHGSHVPKSFQAYRSSQSLAELGFVVVRIDGMGTSNRSKAFHDVCWQNLKDAGFPDRILWMKEAAQRYPYLDLNRVGIYGGSAGGQNTVSALLHHGDFYRVGVADCGCHDNRIDKIWWNELWMGWPIGPHYRENSNATHAEKLDGKLFLTVGELDRNVDPSSTLQLVDALIRANKDFEFLLVPGAGHGVGDSSPYLKRKRRDFFVRHLHDVTPRRQQRSLHLTDEVRQAWEFDDFYRKHLDNDGFPIVSSSAVSDYALREADYLIDRMLVGREDIRRALIDLRFRFSVMAYNEFTTDVPEHASLKPKDFWDRRARGLGATLSRPSVSCGEENLLQYPGDPYEGENILIHEFAHAMHEAIRTFDPDFDKRLEAVYQQAMEEGLWKGKYASSNRYEYWAECVQSYFDDNREHDASHNHVDTRAELKNYDPRIYDLINETYRDNPWRYLPPRQRKTAGHLTGYDFENAPAFEWPEHLVEALARRGETVAGERLNEVIKRNIAGWNVWVDIQLLEGFDEKLGRKALKLLEHQLYGITLLMPPDRLESLQTVAIRLDRESKTLKGIQYHPSERWLRNNGHDPRVAKMVHFPRAANFVSRSLFATQPRVLLHELAHAYHDQILGFDHEAIREAYEAARDGGQYEAVQHIRGRTIRHYALTDHKEYFAEGTEAYFGANDFYPYVRAELQEHDPQLYELLKEIWGEL